MTAGKEAVLRTLDSGALHPFHSGQYTRGHLPTDFRRWAMETQAGQAGLAMQQRARRWGVSMPGGEARCLSWPLVRLALRAAHLRDAAVFAALTAAPALLAQPPTNLYR